MNSVQRYRVKLIQEDNFPYKSTHCHTSEDTKSILTDILKVHEWHNEKFGIACLSNQNYLIGYHIINEGTIDECGVAIREIALRALLNNAKNIILFHNHPGSSLQPSTADIDLTRKAKEALKILDINIVDHIILTEDGNSLSMAEKGLV